MKTRLNIRNPNRNKLFTYLFSALVASLVFGAFLYFLPKIEKYTAKPVSSEYTHNEIWHFDDLDYDGKTERIRIDKNFMGMSAFIVEKTGTIYFQHNIPEPFANNNFLTTGDFNNDSIKEIYYLTTRNDSLFISAINGITEETVALNVFVSTYEHYAGLADYSVNYFEMRDFDNDGFNDLFFVLSCGFSYVTRKCVIYNVRKNQIKTSPVSAFMFLSSISFYDINRDGRPEIFGDAHAPGNAPGDYPFTDHFNWLMLLNADLDWEFPPVKTGIEPGNTYTRPLISNGQNCMAIFKNYRGNKDDSTFIGISDLKGRIIRHKTLPMKQELLNPLLWTLPEDKPEKICLLQNNGTLRIMNDWFENEKEIKLHPFTDFLFRLDADNDGKKEFFLSNLPDLVIVSSDLKYVSVIPGILNVNTNWEPCIVKTENGGTLVSLQTETHCHFIEYRQTRLFGYRYAIYAAGWLILFLAVHLVGSVFQRIAVKRLESEKQLAALQITALEKQLSPHFILNILNSIGSLYETKQTEKAQNLLAKYGKLLHIVLFNSGKLSVPLKKELEFTRNYVELEKARFAHPFEFEMVCDESLENMEVPKMLIHSFCENAIKHGLRHLNDRTGFLSVRISRDGNTVKATVSDNGIGREKAKAYSSMSTGQGLKITNQTLDIYNKLTGVRINYKIYDIYKAEKPEGTRVEIFVPVDKPSRFLKP